jgi:hypothetical protein
MAQGVVKELNRRDTEDVRFLEKRAIGGFLFLLCCVNGIDSCWQLIADN